MWVASLTDDVEKKKGFIKLVNAYLQETASRVPFKDWYESSDGGNTETDFRARSVQGGCFILLL